SKDKREEDKKTLTTFFNKNNKEGYKEIVDKILKEKVVHVDNSPTSFDGYINKSRQNSRKKLLDYLDKFKKEEPYEPETRKRLDENYPFENEIKRMLVLDVSDQNLKGRLSLKVAGGSLVLVGQSDTTDPNSQTYTQTGGVIAIVDNYHELLGILEKIEQKDLGKVNETLNNLRKVTKTFLDTYDKEDKEKDIRKNGVIDIDELIGDKPRAEFAKDLIQNLVLKKNTIKKVCQELKELENEEIKAALNSLKNRTGELQKILAEHSSNEEENTAIAIKSEEEKELKTIVETIKNLEKNLETLRTKLTNGKDKEKIEYVAQQEHIDNNYGLVSSKSSIKSAKTKLKSNSKFSETKREEREEKLKSFFSDFPITPRKFVKALENIKPGLSGKLTAEEINNLCQNKSELIQLQKEFKELMGKRRQEVVLKSLNNSQNNTEFLKETEKHKIIDD
ncbi:3897_t:CDS:2, partial [Paraglomus occultum]